eukprot:4576740-Prymnesium_polylepis.1
MSEGMVCLTEGAAGSAISTCAGCIPVWLTGQCIVPARMSGRYVARVNRSYGRTGALPAGG